MDDEEDLPVTVQQWLELYGAYASAPEGDLDRMEQELDSLELAMTPDERALARNMAGRLCKRIENEDKEGF